jgi:hypothetical protein
VGGRSRSVGVTLIAGLVALGMACAGDDGNDPQASDTPDAGSDDAENLSPEAEVEAAYLAYWDMVNRLSAAPNPEDPDIVDHAAGKALLELVDGLATLVERGHVIRTGPAYAHSVESVEVEGERAVLQDCVIDDSTIEDEGTGEVVGGGESTSGVLRVTLVLDGGSWKVEDIEITPVEAGSCSD